MIVRRAVVVVAICGALGAAAAVAQQRPGPVVSGYLFSIDLPDSGSEIRGMAAISARVSGHGDTLRLDLVGMSVDSVEELPSLRPLPFAYDGRALRIPLPEQRADVEAPAVAAQRQIRVDWHGTPRDGLIIQPNARGRWSAFGDDWPQRARDWIPTVDDPAHKAPVTWIVSAPTGLEVVANGRLEQRSAAGGRTAWLYKEDRPLPTYTMVIGATRMTVSEHRPLIEGRDTIPMEVWAYPEDSAFADSIPFRRVTEIVETLEHLIGPFPYEKLAHVESSTRYGGMENSSAIFYAEQGYVNRRMGESVVRHETAHQWFGDAVTERDFHHLWLSEGFASYYDLVVGAELDGDSVLTRGMRRDAQSYMRSRVVDRPVLDTAATDLTQLLDANSYQKGAWVLHMLREYIGPVAFFAGMRDYYRAYRDSSVLSDDFRHVMERASGKTLDWFFAQWLRQPGYPQLDVAWRYDATAREAVLDVAQVQPLAWGTFRLPGVTLAFATAAGEPVRRGVEVAAARRQVLRIPLPAPPTDLRVDPDGSLLLAATVHTSRGGP